MTMTRVWNVTNDPDTDVLPQNLLVLGKLLYPGQFVQVDDSDLKTAHKIKKNVSLKMLAVGKDRPSYLARTERVRLPKDLARSHGGAPVVAIAEAAPAKVESVLSETEKDSDSHKNWKGRRR